MLGAQKLHLVMPREPWIAQDQTWDMVHARYVLHTIEHSEAGICRNSIFPLIIMIVFFYLVWVHIKFSNVHSISLKNATRILIGTAFLSIMLVKMDILIMIMFRKEYF